MSSSARPVSSATAVRRVVGEERRHRLPALGVLGDELGVGVPVLDQQVQQAVEQGEVGARPDLQEQVGLVGGGGAPRVDDDQLGAGLDPVHHPQEQDRVAVGHVRADDEERRRRGRGRRTTRAARPRRATACSRCPRWPCTAASSTRSGWCRRSPWPACSPGTGPPASSARRRRGRPRPARARRRSPAAAAPVSLIASSTRRRHRLRAPLGAGPAPSSSRPGRGEHARRWSRPWCTAGRRSPGASLSPDAFRTVRRRRPGRARRRARSRSPHRSRSRPSAPSSCRRSASPARPRTPPASRDRPVRVELP